MWKAQLYQESLCNPNAVSPVGARGLAQFMPATWRDMEQRHNVKDSPHDDIAIDWGAYYMSKLMRGWSSKRPDYERARLAQASYNAGFGNILKSQRRCGGVRMWDQINPCLSQITGHNAKETITYVSRIERWSRNMSKNEPWSIPWEIQ